MLINEKIQITNFQNNFSFLDMFMIIQVKDYYYNIRMIDQLIFIKLLKEYFKKNLITNSIKYIDVTTILYRIKSKSENFHVTINNVFRLRPQNYNYYYDSYRHEKLPTTWDIHNVYQFISKRKIIFQKIADLKKIYINEIKQEDRLSRLIFIILNFDKLIKDIIHGKIDIQINSI